MDEAFGAIMKFSFLNLLLISFLLSPAGFTKAVGQNRLSLEKATELAASSLKMQMDVQRKKAASDWPAKQLEYKNFILKFDYKIFGEKPVDGRSLYISLHGGGGTTASVNDQQWKNQIQLYRPEEGVYFVPRSPANTWNMWHDYPMDHFIAEIIKDAIVMEDVNPDKVYIMGYSAGGDGVYQLAPRLADHWAAAAMMAGHPGDANMLNLKNLPFAIYMGGKDAAYSRNSLAVEWGRQLDSLAALYKGDFIHSTNVYPDMPHWMQRKDSVAIPWLASFKRNPFPKEVIWIQDDILRNQFYWLGVPLENAKQGQKTHVSISGNVINVLENPNSTLFIYLNDDLLNLDRKLKVIINGKTVFHRKVGRNSKIINETAGSRLDKRLIFSSKITIRDGRVL